MNDFKPGDTAYIFKKDVYGWPWYLSPNPPYTEKGKVTKVKKHTIEVEIPIAEDHTKIVKVFKDEAGKTELEVLQKELTFINVLEEELSEKILEEGGKAIDDYVETLYEDHKRFTTWRVDIQREIQRLSQKEI